ncbi:MULTISPECIES: CRISPR-associated helicase Cas3' [unclassified Streptomyces]|uniref:CRISPR-associated helicase Cas3' n=1 Tax=unclassified Streptomyces TaxID=2593676 RepID=UPI0033B1FF29
MVPDELVAGDPHSSVLDVARELGLPSEVVVGLGALWGKSAEKAGGRVHLLLGHLLDTSAVAALMWEKYLSPWMRWRLNEITGGHGLRFFMWICGVHDCGKATPAFQSIDAVEAARVRAAGLACRIASRGGPRWRHDKAGGLLLKRELATAWGPEHIRWAWPLVAGHHGAFPDARGLEPRPPADPGRGPAWRSVQRAVFDVFTRALGYEDLKAVQPVQALNKAEQLALSGLIVMADWIASNHEHFPGLDDLAEISLSGAYDRAEVGWRRLGLRGGWGEIPVPPVGEDLVQLRFGDAARPAQVQLVSLARELPAPALYVVEAPMGEGKTKGALAAAEVLAARFGFDGVFVAMPTQATCDPMYEQVLRWVSALDDGLEEQVALLHGKYRFNKQWKRLWQPSGMDPEDLYGSVDEDDEFGMACSSDAAEHQGPALWFLGRKRGLLTSFGVGTIDQLLYAATRTRHVMLRFAGLAGKVVVIDEVHAADVYMRQFLTEALRWLGQARVPVILLSATLPPSQRQALVDAYLCGALGRADVSEEVPEPAGYPCVTAAWALGDEPMVHAPREAVPSWRESLPVTLSWLPDVSDDGAAIADAVREELSDGGSALVILNSVERAQGVFARLKRTLDGEVHLLHGRLCAAHRAERTADCLARLGKGAGRDPEKRTVVVATQVAEQSFDADADLLVTDLAPVDLLLQRIGRLHRHEGVPRPTRLRHPRVLVTGIASGADGPVPRLLPTSEAIYGTFPLLRTAAIVRKVAGEVPDQGSGEGLRRDTGETGSWSVPADVPGLVAAAYGDAEICPEAWQAAERAARRQWEAKEHERAKKAQDFLLTAPRDWARPTLSGLHYGGPAGVKDERDLDAVVRDGKRSVEVVIVQAVAGGYAALDGTRIGVHGEALDDEVLEAVLGGTTRLPARLTEAAEAELGPLPGWSGHPWLKYALALVLDASGGAELGGLHLRYDDELGLVVRGGHGKRPPRSPA